MTLYIIALVVQVLQLLLVIAMNDKYEVPDWIKFCAFIPVIGLIAEIIAVISYRN